MDKAEKAGRILLEICTGDPEGVQAALDGGADRVELCSGLAEGGLTPSAAMIEYSCRRIPTNVLIRPRSGDFVYSEEELEVMEEDIRRSVAAGAQGIVVGVLTPEGKVDVEACRRLLRHCSGLENTFHRAFDLTSDPYEALEDIIGLGFARILTSGQASDALSGAGLISVLRSAARGRIRFLAGAGVSPENASEIIEKSGVEELHASARSKVKPRMSYRGLAAMGSADGPDGCRSATDAKKVAAIRRAIDMLNKS